MTFVFDLFQKIFGNISLENFVILFFLGATRWIVLTTIIPFFGAKLLPSIVRVSLAFLLSLVTVFIHIDQSQNLSHLSAVFLAGLFLKEILIGFILGFFSSILFYLYEFFGQLIDFARAASMAKLLVPEMRHQSSAMGAFLFQLSLVVFLSVGLHRPMIEALFMSFKKFPLLTISFEVFDQSHQTIIFSFMKDFFETALLFALPIIFVCFLIDLAFGLLNRVAPQINAYFLSLPTKILGGLVILFFVLPFLLDDFVEHQKRASSYFNQFLSTNE